MTHRELETIVRKTLTRLTENDASAISSHDDLSSALGLDSLGRLELLSEMEERFDITIYDLDSDKVSSIAGMVGIIETALAEKEPA